MIIGIEAERANAQQKTGVEHYAWQLIIHLAEIDHHNTYILYLRTKPEEWFFSLPSNFKVKVLPFPVFWTQLRISWEMLIHPIDVLFIPASALPLIHPKNSIVTIHDLAWLKFPETFTWFTRNFLKISTWFAVMSARRIISVSAATKKDLLITYPVDESKITVVHHGYELADKQISQSSNNQVSGMGDSSAYPLIHLSAYTLPTPYVLFLSTLQPRKNLEGLIQAFRQLKTELPDLQHQLVVVGKPGWKFESILDTIEKNKDIVTYLNHVSEADKATILSGASLLVLPSFYEGFGMQILEAFAAGVPVATSNISSMPEVAGEAAVYFDPRKTTDIKESLKNLLLDKSLRDNLMEKGKRRLVEFSWDACARETLAVLTSKT